MLPLAIENSNHHGGGGMHRGVTGGVSLPIIQLNQVKSNIPLKSPSIFSNNNTTAAAVVAQQTAAQNAVNQQQNQSSRYKTELCR